MRILQVIPRYEPAFGGDVLYFATLGAMLAARGHTIRVVTTTAREVHSFYRKQRDELPTGVEVIGAVAVRRLRPVRLPFHRALCRVGGALGIGSLRALRSYPGPLLPRLRAALRQEPPMDLIHTGVLTYDTVLAAARDECSRRGIPLVVSPFLHLGEPYRGRGRMLTALQHGILGAARLVLAMTERERRCLIDEGLVAPRVRVLGVGCDPDAMADGDGDRFRSRRGIEGPIVLHPGTLTHDKGTPHLLEAMKLVWQWGEDATLVLTGSLSPDFRQTLHTQPRWVLRRVRLARFSAEEKADAFAAATVVVLPSRAESYGAVYLEGWAAGKPVIGAWAGGVPDVIDEGVDGFLVPFADSHRIAECICVLLQNSDLARCMGERGREKVRTTCSWTHRVASLERLLQELVC
jgi:glycosyltransferase involved in cell wall biosynthesis